MLTDAVEDYLYARKRLTRATRVWYGHKLRPFVTWCESTGVTDTDQVKADVVRRYQDYRATCTNPRTGQPLGSHSLHSDAIAVKAFLSFCHQEEITTSNQGKRIEVPPVDQKIIEVFTPQQVRAMLSATSSEQTPVLVYRDRAIVSVLIDTGIRASELCELLLENVFFGRDDCFIRIMGKGRKQREVGLGKQARIALNRYITRYRKAKASEAHVFLNRAGEPMTRNGLAQMLRRLGKWANITGVRVSAHTLRHTYAIRFLLGGGSIYVLSRLLGHQSVTTTEVYLRALKSYQARKEGFSVLDSFDDV